MSSRPTYLKLPEIKGRVGISQLSAFTATASEHMMRRLVEILFDGSPPQIVKTVPDRPNISYSVRPVLSKDRQLRVPIPAMKKPAIIFCRSRTSAEKIARRLASSLPGIQF